MPSFRVTSRCTLRPRPSASRTTWQLVRMSPAGSMTKPDPPACSGRSQLNRQKGNTHSTRAWLPLLEVVAPPTCDVITIPGLVTVILTSAGATLAVASAIVDDVRGIQGLTPTACASQSAQPSAMPAAAAAEAAAAR